MTPATSPAALVALAYAAVNGSLGASLYPSPDPTVKAHAINHLWVAGGLLMVFDQETRWWQHARGR